MKNSYDILGVPYDASPEQIDNAYRKLSKKYENRPEKLEELNMAYDSIVMNSSASYRQPFYDFKDIKDKIKANRLEDAEILLDGIPDSSRDAEWHYLKGVVHQKRGWLEESAHYFAKASSMDPSNSTYRAAYRRVNSDRTGGYRTERRASSGNSGCGSCDACDLCCGLLCCDSCCECMGGDFISCC